MPTDIYIRIGRPQDAGRLAVLATQVWLHTYATDGITADIAEYVLQELSPEKYLQTLNDPTSQVLVAEIGPNLVGLAVVKFDIACPVETYSSTELQTLYVQENFMGRGVGKLLLRVAEALARQHSNAALWLTVNASNDRAIAFYEHLSYTKVGTTYFVFGEGRHENHVYVGVDSQRSPPE